MNVRFPKGDLAFWEALQSRVRAHLSPHDGGRTGGFAMWARAGFFFGAYFACWAGVVFGGLPRAGAFGLALAMGFFGCGIALNVGHEASHRLYSRQVWVNDVLYWLAMNGLGTYHWLWKLGHERTHHPFANVPGHDVGSDGGNALRMNPGQAWKPSYRRQHVYGPLLYMAYTLTWVVSRDFRVLARGTVAHERVAVPTWRWAELIAVKVVYFGYMLAVPILLSPYAWWEIVLGFVAMHALLSLYLASMLFTSHLCEEAAFPMPDERGQMPHSYFRHQLVTTMDIHPQSRLASFLLGGFNAHVIHHFFPNVSSVHYGALTRILEETCREFGLPYLKSNVLHAVASHLRYLRRLGAEPERVVGGQWAVVGEAASRGVQGSEDAA